MYDIIKQIMDWYHQNTEESVALGMNHFIDITDDWDYRRLLELCELISLDLLKWAIELNDKSTNPDIAEAVDDFNEILQQGLC